MPRIEQLPNGTYAKRLTVTEQQVIQRLYQEIADREADVVALTTRLHNIENTLSSQAATIHNLRSQVRELEEKSTK